MNDLPGRLAKRVVYLRHALGLKQRELASVSNLSLRHLQDIEAANVDIKLSTLTKLALAFGIKPFQLICIDSNLKISQILKQHRSSTKSGNLDRWLVTPYCPLDGFPISLQVCDRSGLIVYINSKCQQFYGLSRDEIVGKYHCFDFLIAEHEKKDFSKYLEYVSQYRPNPTPYICKFKRIDGKLIPTRIEWSYITGNSQRVIGFFCVLKKDKQA